MIYALILIAEMCGVQCTTTHWELQINGFAVAGYGDMDEKECKEAAEELSSQVVPYFYKLACVETGIARQSL